MKNLWDESARQELSERISLLTLKVKEKKLPIRFTPLKQLIIYGPPFPKNSPTAPELILRQAEDWDGECETLRKTMEAFAARPESRRLPIHPAFGKLSRQTWGALSYKHIDHHLKQFGV